MWWRTNIYTEDDTLIPSNEYAFKWYICKVGLMTWMFFCCIGFFNWFIDPYGVWHSSRIRGLNDILNLDGHERIYKMTRLSYDEKFDALFLGSSTVYNALYPRTFFRYTGKKAYNAGLNGVNVVEMKYVLEQAIYFHPEMKEVIIGLNWFMFSTKYERLPAAFPSNQVGKRFPIGRQCAKVLFSMDAIKDSLGTIWRSLYGKDHNLIDSDGKLSEFDIQLDHAKSHNVESFVSDTIVQIPMFKNFTLSEQSMQAYIEILNICKLHGIKLKVYINPVHCSFLEAVYQSSGGEKFEEWKRFLASQYPIYDFAHYSKISNEPFSELRLYWRNSQHPMPMTGDIVLGKLTGVPLADEVGEFGFLLTNDNVEAVLKHERKLRTAWQSDNPETIRFVEELVNRY